MSTIFDICHYELKISKISIVAQGNVRLTWFKWLNVPTNKAHLYQLSSANSDFEDLTGAYFNV